jgi:O-antigen ligase
MSSEVAATPEVAMPAAESPAREEAAPRSRRRIRRPELWILGVFALLLPTLTLPPHGAWLDLKAYLGLAGGILLLMPGLARGEWTASRVRDALRRPVFWAVFAFLGWVVFSAFLVNWTPGARFEVVRHVGGAAVMLGVTFGVSPRSGVGPVAGILGAAVAAATLTAFLALQGADAARAAGAFHDRQLFAGFLCVLTPLVLAASQLHERPLTRAALQVTGVIALAAILVTESRSVWAGTLVGLIILGVLWLRSGGLGDAAPNPRRALIPLLMVAAAVTTFLVSSRLGGTLGSRAATVTALSRDPSFQWRVGMWSKAGQMALDRPLLGWGIGSFPLRQALYFHEDAPSRTQKEILTRGAGLLENPHNMFLHLAAELGFLGLALYLGIVAVFAWTVLRARRNARGTLRQGLLLASLAAVAAQLVSAVGSPAWEFAECSLFWWLALGVGLACAGVGDRRRLEGEPGSRHPLLSSRGGALL